MKYCYVGSTQNFTRRKCQHKFHCKTLNQKIYQVIRENGGWDNWSMIKIEDTDYETKLDAHKRERELLEYFGNGMNERTPSRNWEEECQKEHNKQYRDTHKPQANKYAKQYREDNREQINEWRKQYRKDNKEQITEYKKQYYEDNKEQIAEQRNKKYNCECGSTCSLRNKSAHLKSKKHQNFLQTA